jgi:hypothetical protein
MLAVGIVLAAAGNEWFLAAVYGEDEVQCGIGAFPVQLPHVPEASGLTASRRHPDLFWTFNDSGDPTLYGISTNGDLRAHVQVPAMRTGNWEDVSAGPCGSESCLYLADIGDNKGTRTSIRVIRFPEPRQRDHVAEQQTQFEGVYPDGPRDAEAAFVLPDGRFFVIAKGKFGAVYRFPLQAGQVTTLERVVALPLNDVTDADASADGTRLVVRTRDDVVFYRMAELLNGDVEHGTAVTTKDLGESQGEGVAFGAEGLVGLAGEGGGKKKKNVPGTLATLQCEFKDGTSR